MRTTAGLTFPRGTRHTTSMVKQTQTVNIAHVTRPSLLGATNREVTALQPSMPASSHGPSNGSRAQWPRTVVRAGLAMKVHETGCSEGQE